jgi:hypothetical protein
MEFGESSNHLLNHQTLWGGESARQTIRTTAAGSVEDFRRSGMVEMRNDEKKDKWLERSVVRLASLVPQICRQCVTLGQVTSNNVNDMIGGHKAIPSGDIYWHNIISSRDMRKVK